MSAFYYYKKRGYSQVAPKQRNISNASLTSTITLWTPLLGARIALTNLSISSNAAGTIAFYFENTLNNSNQSKIAEFSCGSSATIFPVISSWESTVNDAILAVRVSNGLTNQWQLTAEGFDIWDT